MYALVHMLKGFRCHDKSDNSEGQTLDRALYKSPHMLYVHKRSKEFALATLQQEYITAYILANNKVICAFSARGQCTAENVEIFL